MKLDILAFGAHPDDIELSCAGTLAMQTAKGYACGAVDLTQGEMGTRGTKEIRLREAAEAAKILGLKARENLAFADGFFANDTYHQLKVVEMIRKYQPEVVITNAPTDRHPDHGRGAALVKQACFLAGLKKVETTLDGQKQEAYRPQQLLHYIQFQSLIPDFIVDIGQHINTKLASIKAYASQFYNPNSKEPKTVISSKNFLDSVTYRAQDMGRLIGADYGEGFIKSQDLGVSNLMHLSGVR
jgi:bacillithiol biosynthesis deacetylase BshB1